MIIKRYWQVEAVDPKDGKKYVIGENHETLFEAIWHRDNYVKPEIAKRKSGWSKNTTLRILKLEVHSTIYEE